MLQGVRAIYMHRPERAEDRTGPAEELWAEIHQRLKNAGFSLVEDREQAQAFLGLAPVVVSAPPPTRISAVWASLEVPEGSVRWKNAYWPYNGINGAIAATPAEATLMCADGIAGDVSEACGMQRGARS